MSGRGVGRVEEVRRTRELERRGARASGRGEGDGKAGEARDTGKLNRRGGTGKREKRIGGDGRGGEEREQEIGRHEMRCVSPRGERVREKGWVRVGNERNKANRRGVGRK